MLLEWFEPTILVPLFGSWDMLFAALLALLVALGLFLVINR
jgi:hypothetical protein